MYGTIEKMYDILLAALDVAENLNDMSPEDQYVFYYNYCFLLLKKIMSCS